MPESKAEMHLFMTLLAEYDIQRELYGAIRNEKVFKTVGYKPIMATCVCRSNAGKKMFLK